MAARLCAGVFRMLCMAALGHPGGTILRSIVLPVSYREPRAVL
jgi:hypothetical protein